MSERRRERKVVTVLFCDLVGFTAQAETLDPEDVEAILRPYHERLKGELERFGGTVEKFIGDAVMAVFGAPTAHEDDPERAVRAALAIREWAREEEGPQVRIAVNTGEAVVTLGARPEQGEGIVAGDVVNTASRLQAAGPTNGVLVGERTYRATRDRIDYREANPAEAKGKAEPILVWEALEARSRFGVDTVHSGSAPLVGRERELTLLVDALSRARAEREPQLVTLIGVPGIGKSRLVYELMQLAEADPEVIRWRQGRCLPYGDGITFWALGEVVKSHAGIFETDVAERAEEKLRAMVSELLTEAADRIWLEAQLRPLVGLAAQESAVDDRQQEAFAAWIRLFETLAEDVPLVLVIEDLHWADEKLLDFLDELLERAAGVAMLVLATARPELLDRRPNWGGGKANALTLSPSPLSDDDTARLLGALLDRSLLSAGTQRAVVARAGGNPLFAEQFARILQERGGGEPPLPESVQGIIAARLDTLASTEKGLLQDASVHGKVFWEGALAGVSGGDRSALRATLRALERKGFLRRQRRSSVAGEMEYTFRHGLLRDVAYAQLPRAARADKHVRAAEWLESLAEGRDDHVELLADHYARALDLARAAGEPTEDLERRARVVFERAGSRASALNAFAAAIRYVDQALQLWPLDDVERPRLLALRAKALHFVGDETRVYALEEARDALLASREPDAAAELEALLAQEWWHRGHRDEAFVHLERARSLVGARAPSLAKGRVLSQVARYRAIAGDRQEAIAAGEEAVAIGEALGDEELQGRALNSIGTAKATAGDLDDAVTDLERAVELTVGVNSPEAARAYHNLAYALGNRGEVERSQEVGREAERVAQRFGDEQVLRFRRANEAFQCFMEAAWDDALHLADEFIAQCEAGLPHYHEPLMRALRAIVYSWRGHDGAALADAAKAVDLSRNTKDPQSVHGALVSALTASFFAGRARDARASALQLLRADRAQVGTNPGALYWLAATAEDLDLENEVRALVAEAPDSPLKDAAEAVLVGNWNATAAVYEGIFGAAEAYARLQAAKGFVAEGRRAEADEQLSRSLAFFRKAGATRFVREAEAMLGESP